MSQTPQIDDSVAENYRQVRAESGRTWEEMAVQFERDADPLPPEHGAPYRQLAAWARAQDPEPTTEPATEPVIEPEQPVDPTPPRKRTTTPKTPTRTS